MAKNSPLTSENHEQINKVSIQFFSALKEKFCYNDVRRSYQQKLGEKPINLGLLRLSC
jgi:hypothetical protein